MYFRRRCSNTIYRELVYVIKNANFLSMLIRYLIDIDRERQVEVSNYVKYIAGYIEYLIAEALSLLLNAELYICRTPTSSINNYIIWNGRIITSSQSNIIPIMAGPGLPDIEVYSYDKCLLVEVTLARSSRIILREIEEITRHHPQKQGYTVYRVLLAPLLGDELIEVRNFVSSYLQERSIHNVLVASLYALPKFLSERKAFRSISEFVNSLQQYFPNDIEVQKLEIVSTPEILCNILRELYHVLKRIL